MPYTIYYLSRNHARSCSLLQIHRGYQSCQAPVSSTDVNIANLEISHDKKYAQLHLPLTAVMEPNDSVLQSFGDEIPVDSEY